jgi:hypothetical protein
MSLYKISECSSDVKIVSLIQLIRKIKNQDLLKSKREVESLLEGSPIFFEADDMSACIFCKELIDVGVSVEKLSDLGNSDKDT